MVSSSEIDTAGIDQAFREREMLRREINYAQARLERLLGE